MKRWVMFSLALVMVISVVLAGCSQGSNNTGSSTKQQGTSEGSKPKAPVKFSVFVSGSNMVPAEQDVITKQLNKDLNMNMEFNVVTTEYAQQLNVRMAGGNAPDVFQVDKNQLHEYTKQGLLLDIEQYLDRMPQIQASYSKEDLDRSRINGKLYAIPKRPYLPMSTLWIRQDWLDTLGLERPKTLEDIKNIAIAFKEDDPDGNNKPDTYAFTGIGLTTIDPVNAPATFDWVFSAFGIAGPGHFMSKDGKAVYSTVLPETKEALAYIKELIDLQVVDPEFLANKGLKHQEKAFVGQAGLIHLNWATIARDKYIEQYKEINPNASWEQLDALEGPGGKYHGFFDITATSGRYAISKNVEKDPDKLNKILEFFDYITEGPGHELVMYGIEGEHYKKENGEIVTLPAISDIGYSVNHQLTGRNEREYLSTKFVNQIPFIEFAAALPRVNTFSELVPIPEGLNADDIRKYELEELTKFIYGKRPLSEFDAFVDTLYSTYNLEQYMAPAVEIHASLNK